MKISGYRLDEILAERRHIGPVCAAAQGLYAELCRQYNKFPDPAGFECANGFLMVAMGNCDEKSIVKWRGQLEAAGMINFISRGREKKPGIYQMLNPLDSASTTGNIPVAEKDKEASNTGNIPVVKTGTTGIFPVDITPNTGNFPVDTNPTTGKFPVVESGTDDTTTGNFPVALPEIFLPTLNKSKLVSTNVLTLSLKKKGEEKTEESTADSDFQMPQLPTVADPFETAAAPPAPPPVAAAPPKPKKAKAPRQVFSEPSIEEVAAHLALHNKSDWPAEKCTDEAEKFWHHHNSKGWKLGNTQTLMASWQSAVHTWLKKIKEFSNARTHSNASNRPAGSNPKTGAAATPRKGGGTIEELQSLRNRPRSNPEERTEFTAATVVE